MITLLDQSTINQIAAGEVIERPASVVKELLENAIDAGATAVTVEIRDGGISFIRVTDNGCGIPKEEVPTAFLRHATSKIKSVEDLFTVSSLGFRGEALASIAAVSQVELITKTGESFTGTRYQVEGGKEISLEEVGAPDGTTFIARNLFYNTPARKKFLKTPQTEGAHVAELVEKISLSRPDISIRFIQNNQNKLHTSGNHNLKDIIYTIYGREIAGNLLPVKCRGQEVSIDGFAGKPLIARSNRGFENYFINGRYIKSSIIAKAIEEAYKPYMMQHKYPFTMLHFTIEPEFLDVNVHPTKMELRFRDGEGIYKMILEALQDALAHKELIVEVGIGKEEKKLPEKKPESPAPEPFERKRLGLYQKPEEKTAEKPERQLLAREDIPSWMAAPEKKKPEEKKLEEPPKKQREEPQQLELFDGKLLEPKSRSRHKLIGQLFDTYWMVEFNDQLYIIDQHAAHEKILYERTMASIKTRDFGTQMADPPIILTLSQREEVLLKANLEYIRGIGFEIEHFGGREYAVRGVPANLPSIARKDLLIEMIDGLSEEAPSHSPDMIYEKVASMSCKAAVKGNHAMSTMEADALIDQLLELENPYACPHGRPVIISMSKYELEKKFKRIL